MMNGVNKEYKIIISERAKDMLVQHMRFLADVSLQAADSFRIKVIESSESLRYLPKRNPFIYDALFPTNKYRKLVINERYLMIYQIKDDIVYIDYILDCRQNYSWLI